MSSLQGGPPLLREFASNARHQLTATASRTPGLSTPDLPPSRLGASASLAEARLNLTASGGGKVGPANCTTFEGLPNDWFEGDGHQPVSLWRRMQPVR